jgi:hypothetical protein
MVQAHTTLVKTRAKQNRPVLAVAPRIAHGYIWRRRDGKHLTCSEEHDGVLYWTFDVFGGKDRGGRRETICLETGSMPDAVAEVNYLCRMIAWPPPGCAMDDEAAVLYEHSITGAAAWHYRNKYLRSLARIGRAAAGELAGRINSSTAPARGKSGKCSSSSS